MKRKLAHIKVYVIRLIIVITNSLRTSNLTVLRTAYPFVNKFISVLLNLSSYHVISHDMYVAQHKLNNSKILIRNRIGFSSNLVYNDCNDEQKLLPFPLEDIKLYLYENLIINGDSDLLIDRKNNVAINNLCANKDDRILYHDSVMLAQRDKTILIRNSKNVSEIYSGIVISGLFSTNYYHALYDNLIRIIVVKDCDIPKEIPFIIDSATYNIPSLRRALECLMGKHQRPIILLEPRTPYLVKNMYYISHVNYIIPSIKSYDLCKPSDTIFDIDLTFKMRNLLLSIKSDKVFPRKIFISRAKTSKRNFNEDEVFVLLQKNGFERVFPENLTLEEQISLFYNAEVVVGGGGAAMTNLLFCDKGCKVLIINKTMDQVPCFTTIPYALGIMIRHYGHKNNDKRLHSNYIVNPQEVVRILELF